MDTKGIRETFSLETTADEEKSTVPVASGLRIRIHCIQHCRRAEIIIGLILLSIIAGMVLYICFGLQAQTVPTECKGVSTSTPTGMWHQRLAATPVLRRLHTECGGIVHVPRNGTVYIAYKNGTDYADNEHCLWVISSEAKQVVLRFRDQNFEKPISFKEDGFIVAQLDTSSQELRCDKWMKEDYKKWKYLSVPSFLHFTSYETPAYGFRGRRLQRRGFVISLNAIVKRSSSLNRWIWPSISFVGSRKRGMMNLLDFETRNFPTEPVIGGPMYQNSFGVFPTSSNHGISRRNFSCVGSVAPGNITEHSCCDFVDGYEIKQYHEGEACSHAPWLSHGNRSVVTEQSFIVFRWPQSDGNNTPCRVKWTE